MEFVEAPLFTKLLEDYINDKEYAALQIELSLRPDAGSLIPGSGGIRKLRWGGKGKGKRGGLRVIYYWQVGKDEIWMLAVYAKNEAEDIPVSLLREIKEAVER